MEKLTMEEIDKKLENLRKDRLDDESYFINKKKRRPRAMCYFMPFGSRPVKTYEVKLICSGCKYTYDAYPDENPDKKKINYIKVVPLSDSRLFSLLNFDDSLIMNGEDEVAKLKKNYSEKENYVTAFRTYGMDAKLKWYCPECATESSRRDSNYAWFDKTGYFCLVLETEDRICSNTIPRVLCNQIKDSAILDSREEMNALTATQLEYKIALDFLRNSQIKYADYNQIFAQEAEENSRIPSDRLGLIKIKVDKALSKILGVKIDYDANEMMKTYRVINDSSKKQGIDLLDEIETMVSRRHRSEYD